jgi:hypothetical protein
MKKIFPSAIPTQGSAKPDLTTLLKSELDKFPAKVGVYVKHLETGEEAGSSADDTFDSESVIKIPIMMLAFQLAEKGELDLDRRYEITRADLEPGSGVFQHHDLGATPTLRDLVTEMIMTSDNTATRILVREMGGVRRINEWLHQHGYKHTRAGPIEQGWRPILGLIDPALTSITVEEAHGLLYAVWKSHQFELYEPLFLGENRKWLEMVSEEALDAAFKVYADRPDLWYGRTTPRETGKLLEDIVNHAHVSKISGDRMQAIMRLQKSGVCRIPHYLDVPVAHKTGDLPPTVANDVGMVYADCGRIIISFFAMNIDEPYGEFEDRIGQLARGIVDYFEN